MAHRRHAESPSVCHLTQAISAPHFAMDTCVHVRMVAPHNSHITGKDHKSFSMQPTNTCTPSFSLHSAFWSLLCPNTHQMHPDFLTYLVLGFSENHSQKIRPPGVKHMGDLHLFKLSLICLSVSPQSFHMAGRRLRTRSMGLIMWSEYAHIIYGPIRMMDGTFLSTTSWFAEVFRCSFSPHIIYF